MTATKDGWCLTLAAAAALSITLSGVPSVYPTGTTIFKPDKTWSGYTVFITPDSDGVVLMEVPNVDISRYDAIWISEEVAGVPPSEPSTQWHSWAGKLS